MSNSVETSLTTLALCHWLQYSESAVDAVSHSNIRFKVTSLLRALLYAGLATMIRPTNAVIWVFMLALLIWRLRSSYVVSVRTLVICVWFGYVLDACVAFDAANGRSVTYSRASCFALTAHTSGVQRSRLGTLSSRTCLLCRCSTAITPGTTTLLRPYLYSVRPACRSPCMDFIRHVEPLRRAAIRKRLRCS